MNHTYKTILLTASILGSSLTYASTAAISLTNETAKADVNLTLGAFGVNGGIIHDTEENSSVAHAGVTIEDRSGSGPLQSGVGIRVFAVDADVDNDDDEISGAVAVGGWYRYTLPEANRLSIYSSVYYSPEVLAFSNLHHMYSYDFRFEYSPVENTRTFIQYGNTVIVYDDDSRKEINKGFSVGAEANF